MLARQIIHQKSNRLKFATVREKVVVNIFLWLQVWVVMEIYKNNSYFFFRRMIAKANNLRPQNADHPVILLCLAAHGFMQAQQKVFDESGGERFTFAPQ